MLAYMNAEAYAETMRTGRAVYYSRSRRRLWRKGEESGHFQRLVGVYVDCDRDTILLQVEQTGAACHEGYPTCFFREATPQGLRIVEQRLVDPAAVYGAHAASLHPSNPTDSNPIDSMSIESKLAELKLTLPPPPKPAGVYKPLVIVGDLAYLSGHGPLLADGTMMTGKVGVEVDQQAGYQAARQTALALLSSMKQGLGNLDRVKRVIKTLGMVNCAADFKQHPAVINGCSELFAQLYGADNGVGARSAVGMGSLPGNISVEIEMIVQIDPIG